MRIYFRLLILLLFLGSCSGNRSGKQEAGQLPFKAIPILPVMNSIAPAKMVVLDTCKAPQVFTITDVPTRPNYNDAGAGQPICTLKPAVFSVNMTTYEAEQGLYSLVNTIKKDKNGNFWLGTGGGGVIRYDGKTATSYTTAQGLASNNIRAIAEDRFGNFWFGSQGGGASYYNGRFFTKMTTAQGLSSNNIRGLVADKSGITWFATFGGGISIYNGISFTCLNTKNGLPSNYVNCILQSHHGDIWCGTDSGVCHFLPTGSPVKAGNVTTYTTANGLGSNRILCLTEDSCGHIWAGTDGGGLACISPVANMDTGHVIKTYTVAQGLPDNKIKSVFADSRGKIWLCTAGGGVCCFDPLLLVQATAGNLKPGLFTTYNTEQGLPTNKMVCAAEDENGNLWFGTDGGGVCRFDGEAFKINIVPRDTHKTISIGLSSDKAGNIWLSNNDSGFSCYDGICFRNYYFPGYVKDNSLMGMIEGKDGRLWFGTSVNGLIMCDKRPVAGHPAHFTPYTTAQGLSSNRISCLAEDKDGKIWIGTDAGADCFDGKSLVHYSTLQGLGNNNIWCSLIDKDGHIWFGTFGGGLSMFLPHPADGGPARFISYTTAQGLASNSIKGIAQDKNGNLWIGTGGGGVSRFDGNSFTNYTTINGLANNVVVSVSEDKYGNIWFGTNEGFALLKGYRSLANPGNNDTSGTGILLPADNSKSNMELAEHDIPVFEKFNFKNGFPIRDLNNNAMYIDTSGVIWAGTADKLIKFDYSKLNKNNEAPHVFINSVQTSGEKICWSMLNSKKKYAHIPALRDETYIADSLTIINEELAELGDISTPQKRDSIYQKCAEIQFDSITPFYSLPVNLVLPYNHNNITFDFAAIALARPKMIRYQYFLEGYDKDWSPVTARGSASFGNIHEGKYTFQLKAQSPDGVWSNSVTYSFEVLPPFYRTWWAYILYCLAIAGFINLIMHFRVRLLKQENARLETIVAERTAQIEQEKAAVLKQANDLKTLNLFKDKTFSILSHDLRGPINTSATVIAMLDDDRISADEFKMLKEGVVKQLTSTSSLLENLLRWAKNSMEGDEQPHPKNVNINDLVNRNALLFAESLKAKNISLTNQVPREQFAFCDEEHLDIVIRNLVANAIKFTERNGTIQVTADTKDDYKQLSVTDSGVGMTGEQLEKLFKPLTENNTYGTEGEKGTGLGLLLCYDFIKINKGIIEVKSEINKGTTFTVVLPAGKI